MKAFFSEYGGITVVAVIVTLLITLASPVGASVKDSVTGILTNFGGTANTITAAMPDNYATLLGTGIADGDKDGLHYHNNQLFTGDCSDYHYEEGVKQYRTGMLYEKDGYYYFNGTLANGTYYGAKYVMGERFTGVDGSTYYEEGILGTGSYAGVYYKNGEEQFSLNTDLTVLMNDIEAAIQAKTGSTNPIAPDDFPEEISGIITDPSTNTTATAAELLSGKTAYSQGSQITGTMKNNGAVSATINPGESYTIPSGYHNGSGKVTANKGKQVFDLGTNTSFNVKTVCQQNGIDYTKLTADNFVCVNVKSSNNTWSYNANVNTGTASASEEKSYNKTTGVLNWRIAGHTYCYNTTTGANINGYAYSQVHAYLVY